MAGIAVELCWLDPERDADLTPPRYMTAGAAGADIVAALDAEKPVVIAPGTWVRVPTGFSLAIPMGYEVQVRPRSGLAWRQGLTVLNAPGTIDSDYRGEVQVLLINHGSKPATISRGDRIAQLVVAPVVQPRFVEIDALSSSERGSGGFGHTG
jgi:dUTP pyrophosphatase